MTDLEKLRQWLDGFPGRDRLKELRVDFTAGTGENGGLFPGGLRELARKTDIFGTVTTQNRYSFGLLFVLEKDADDGTDNAQWLLELQNWIQEQSVRGLAPVFGSRTVAIRAGKGTLKNADPEGRGLYSAELTVDFLREFT